MLRRHDQGGVAMPEPRRQLPLPDLSRLADFPTNGMGLCMNDSGASDAAGTHEESSMNYENTDIQEITRRQLREDIMAYRYDLDLCRSLIATEVTPQEARSLQLRTLDIGHQIRHAQHRIELIEARQRQSRTPVPAAPYHNGVHASHRDTVSRPLDSPSDASAFKRPRISVKRSYSADVDENGGVGTPQQPATTTDTKTESFTPVNSHHAHPSTNGTAHASSAVQRLGFWKCRLCVATKYLNAGPNRVPSEPSKWPLKDVSKMLNHFLDLHTEHTPAERCMELGAALAQNRGPFEYWLTQTRKQDLEDTSVMDNYVSTLQAGNLPEGLRRLNRAAGLFPNSTHEKRAA